MREHAGDLGAALQRELSGKRQRQRHQRRLATRHGGAWLPRRLVPLVRRAARFRSSSPWAATPPAVDQAGPAGALPFTLVRYISRRTPE